MTILAKMHDRMAQNQARYAGPMSATANPAGHRAVQHQPQMPAAAPPAPYVPANLFDETSAAQKVNKPPVTHQSMGLSLPEIFRLYADAQDEPGRTIRIEWNVGESDVWMLSTTFDSISNLAQWQLDIHNGCENTVAMNCQSRDLTGIYRAVLENRRHA